MHVATAILAVVSLAAAQEIGFTDGDSVVAGPNAISNPNVNNGWQADSSLFAGSGGAGQGPEVFNNIAGSSFTHINSNTAFKDNLVNNPSTTFVSGNDGWSANGDRNQLGPVQNDFGAVHKRGGDVVFASNHHQTGAQTVHAARPLPVFAAYAKRGGDVVFGQEHHQVNHAAVPPHAVAAPHIARPLPFGAAFAKRELVVADGHFGHSVPVVSAWPHFVSPLPIARPAVVAQPVRAEADGQKATIVQNHA
ncbi:hypothetical protein IWW50_006286 [Coemansia erecta]|nr:hypothetical protein IWW50_006286 [Coemansia erecta]